MTQPVPPQTSLTPEALLAAYQASSVSIRQQITDLITQLWNSLTSWRDADIDRFAHQAASIVAAGQRQIASVTEAYLNQRKTGATGAVSRPTGVSARDVSGKAVRNGTDPVDVYRRSGKQVYKQLAEGKPLQEAVDSGLKRAVKAAETDLQLAKTHTARKVLTQDREATGWRRVLEGDFSCALCVVASTQRYHKQNLMAIHPGCDCSVDPIYSDHDVQVIDPERLEAAHDLIQSTFNLSDRGARNPDYRKLLITHDHGELGPLLAIRGQHFDGPSDIKRVPDRGTKQSRQGNPNNDDASQ